MRKARLKPKATPKAQATGGKILDAALGLFRSKGFDQTTMRDIAAKAGVATGAAYYYYPSKDAIVMAFYQRTFDEMQMKIGKVLAAPGSLEVRMRELIRVKLEHFGRNRGVLRGILKNGADPKHPVSPFSAETKAFREMEIAWFRRLVGDEGVRLPRELETRIPEVLWVLHIGMLFFWIADDSPRQSHTLRLIDQGMSTVTALLRLSSPLPAIVEAS
ncbi:MAG TPA: TetR/AcrR family transcriptional regulator [Bryobacteraceae bacterium]|nr:TetR/AcrR family transcriptional regulator [Bryobacteraceae bacterium]